MSVTIPIFKEDKQDTELYQKERADKTAIDMYFDAQRLQRR